MRLLNGAWTSIRWIIFILFPCLAKCLKWQQLMVVPKLVNLNQTSNLLVISDEKSTENVCVSMFELNSSVNRLQIEYGTNQFTIDRSQARILSLPYVPSLHLHSRPSADIQIKGRLVDTLASVHVWNLSTFIHFSTFSFVHLNTSKPLYFADSSVEIEFEVFDEQHSRQSLPVTVLLLDSRMQIMKQWHQVRSRKDLPVKLTYRLCAQPDRGIWTVWAQIQNQRFVHHFLVSTSIVETDSCSVNIQTWPKIYPTFQRSWPIRIEVGAANGLPVGGRLHLQITQPQTNYTLFSTIITKFKRDVTFHVPLDRLPPSTPSIDSLSMYQPTSGERVLRITALFRSESQSNRLSCRSQVTVRASNHPRWHAICPNTLRDFQILDPLPIRSCCFLMHTSATYDATLFEVVYEAQLEPENASIGSIAENSTSNSLPHVRWISLHEEFIEPSHWPLPLTFWFQFNPNQYLNSDQRRRLIAIRLTLSTRQRLPPFQHHQVISMHFKRNRRSVVIAQNQSASMKINLNGAVPFQSHFPVRPSKHFNSADYHWSSLAKTPIYARLVRTNSANLYRVGESIALKLICTGWPVSARFYYVVQSNGRLLWSGVLRMTGTVHVFRLIALPSMSPMSVVSVYGEHVALTDFVQIQVESEVDRRTVETSHINLNHRTDDNVLTYGLRRLANLHYLQAQLPFSSVLLTALCRQPNLAPFFLHHTQREIQTLNQLFDFPQVKWNVAKHAINLNTSGFVCHCIEQSDETETILMEESNGDQLHCTCPPTDLSVCIRQMEQNIRREAIEFKPWIDIPIVKSNPIDLNCPFDCNRFSSNATLLISQFESPDQMFVGEFVQIRIWIHNLANQTIRLGVHLNHTSNVQAHLDECLIPIGRSKNPNHVEITILENDSQHLLLVVLHAIKVGNAIVSAQIRPDHGPESLVHLSIQVIPSGLHVQQHFSQWIEIPDRENSLKTVSLSTEDLLSPAINRFQFAQMLRHQRVRVRLGASPFVLNEPLEVQIRSQTCDHRLMRLNADLELWLEMLQQHQLHQKVNQAPSWSRSEQLQESIANQIQQLVVHWNPNGWFESIVSLNQSNTTYQSVTLTASVIQTLARLRLDSFYVPKLHQVISINYEMIFKTVSWLLKQQQFHGQFPAQSLREVDTSNQSLHPKRVLTVTATVLSALNTVETLLNHFVNESNQFKMNEVRQQKASQISPSFDDIQSDPYDAFNRDVHSQLKSLKPAIQRAVHYLKSGLDIENRLVRYVHTGSIHELFTSMQEADEDLLVITLALSEQDRRCGHFLINALHERVRRQTDRGLYYGSRSLAPKRFRVQQHRIARLPSLVEPNESKLVTETALLLLARLALNEYSDNRRFVHFLITRKAHFHRWSSLEATCLALRAIRLSNIADRQQISRDRTWSHPVYAKQNAIHDLSPSIVNATIRIELSGSVDPGFWIKRTLHWPDSVWNGFAFDTEWPEELNTLSISALGPASYALDVHYDLYLADLAQSTLPFVYSFDLHVSISSTKPEALPKESGSRTSDDFMLVPKADLSLRACYRWTLLKQSSNSPFATLIIQLPTGVRPLRLGHISSENDRDTSIVEHFKSINSLMLHLQKVNHDQACFLVDLRVDFPAWNASTDLLAQIYDRHQPELRTIARIQMNYISNLANSPNSINPTSIDRSLGFCSNDLSGVGTRNSAHFITAAINLITLLLIIMLLIVLFRNIYFILFKLRPKKRP